MGSGALIDGLVGELVDAVEARTTPDAEDWLFLAVTDRGHGDDGSHGGGHGDPAVTTVWTLAPGGDIEPVTRGRVMPTMVDATRPDAQTAPKPAGVSGPSSGPGPLVSEADVATYSIHETMSAPS